MDQKTWDRAMTGVVQENTFTLQRLVVVRKLIEYAIKNRLRIDRHEGLDAWALKHRTDILLNTVPMPLPVEQEYRVEWTIDVTAKDHYEAARNVWVNTMKREWPPEADSACVFYVTGKDDVEITIDLEKDKP